MSDERKLILNLLAEGKVTAEEADELLEALEQDAFTKQEEQEQKTRQMHLKRVPLKALLKAPPERAPKRRSRRQG